MLSKSYIESFYISLGKNIRLYRIKKGYNQKRFAELLQISRGSLANIEKGRQRPPIHLLSAITILLDKKTDELIPISGKQLENTLTKEKVKAFRKEVNASRHTKDRIMEFIVHAHSHAK